MPGWPPSERGSLFVVSITISSQRRTHAAFFTERLMTTLHTRATVLATLALSLTAQAQVWNEIGDAGRNGVGAAQSTVGTGPLTTINGSLSITTDVDLYCIRITNAALFRAEVTAYAGQDTMLYLFNADGTLQVYNDDNVSSALSTITSQGVFSSGIYFLGISNFANIPLTGTNSFMTTINAWPGPDVQQYQSSGGVVANWNDNITFPNNATGAYSIALEGAEFHVIPSPGAAALLGLTSLMAARRRR
jgi:hypothetical protein